VAQTAEIFLHVEVHKITSLCYVPAAVALISVEAGLKMFSLDSNRTL